MADTQTPITVEATFAADGDIAPQAFFVNERRFVVAQQGRRWRDDEGRHHFLVMTPIDEVWELLFDPEELHWFVAQRHRSVRTV